MARQSPRAAGERAALRWKTYTVRGSQKARLYDLVLDGLRARDCRILHTSDVREAPLFVVLEMPTGERLGLLLYAFLSNSELTKNRPGDEHRFQIKYSGNLARSLDIAIDSHGLIVTLLVGIDPKRKLFFAIDPAMNVPTPMSRSVWYKESEVERVLDCGWHSWTRNRRPPKSGPFAICVGSESSRYA